MATESGLGEGDAPDGGEMSNNSQNGVMIGGMGSDGYEEGRKSTVATVGPR